MSNSRAAQFIGRVKPDELRVINQPDIIWLFGSSADNSLRKKMRDWAKNSNYKDVYDKIKTPEDFPQWTDYRTGYKNLVDFEIDIVSLAKAIVIFSESPGTHAELGLFSNIPDILKTVVVVVKEEFLYRPHSHNEVETFINLGPFQKIRELWDADDEPIFAYSSHKQEEQQFQQIIDLSIDKFSTTKTQNFEYHFRKHQFYLLLDIIHLLSKSTLTDIHTALTYFSGFLDFDKKRVSNMLECLRILELISKHKSGKNTYYQIKHPTDYQPLIDYIGAGKTFDRSAFLLELRR